MKSASSPWQSAPPSNRGLHTVYSRRQFEWVLQRERARADRVAGEFSLAVFRVRGGDARLTLRLAKQIIRRARATDEIGWLDEECIGALLVATGAEGARAFAEEVLHAAQQKLIPCVSRFYTYPSAWYFDGENHASGKSNGNGSANGNGNGNGHHPRRERDLDSGSDGNGQGGNGHTERNPQGQIDEMNHDGGNGHSPASGNGNGNGNGGAQMTATLTIPETKVARPRVQPVARTSSDLLPFMIQGIEDGLRQPGADGVEELLVRRLPWWKRAIDIVGAGAGIVALAPVMLIVAFAIKATSRGPVIFRQHRAGLGGRPFWIYKFRTMIVDAEKQKADLRAISEQDGPAFKLTHDPRITPVGRFLRETSLDELPQLWNVLIGNMSLVGPRPLPMDESAECEQWQRRRLDVTPGLTCIWQVKGRSRVSFAEWMRMDRAYIGRRTLFHDVKIMAQTIPAVLMRKGAK